MFNAARRSMPIRFPCPECKQLLGVSTRKVGSQVTCPKCSASVTVPTAEEAAAAVAMRRFEHPDVEEALNTLVIFDRGDVVAPGGQSEATSRRLEGEERSMLLIPRKVVYFQAGLLAAVAILFFAAGWWIGGSSRSATPQNPAAGAAAVRIDALLHYRDLAGDLRPDGGAVVLILPVDKRVTDKISATPFEPGSPPPNAASAVMGKLNLVGGTYGRTDASGKLSGLVLSQPGKHHVLLLSNQGRRAGEPRPQDLATLGTYLDGAAELLGNRQYRLTTEAMSGEVAIAYDFGDDER